MELIPKYGSSVISDLFEFILLICTLVGNHRLHFFFVLTSVRLPNLVHFLVKVKDRLGRQ